MRAGAPLGPRNETPVDDAATRYARDVMAGRVVVGRPVRLACERHLRDLIEGPARGLRWDPEEVEDQRLFFLGVRHSKGRWAGSPIVLSPFQLFVQGSVYGWKRADGMRRFRLAYVEVARKNGKSTQAAGNGNYLAFFDDEAGAEVYAAATKRDQAKIVWGEAKQMVLRSPRLRERLTVLTANLSDHASGSKFEPLGSDADNLDGLNIHAAIIDELHAHRSRALWDVLITATGARRQPLIVVITTAGYDRHSICWEQHDYAVKVLERIVEDDAYFTYIATIDEGDDWTDPAVWVKANPNLGVTLQLDDLRQECRRAQETPAAQSAFKRLRLNVWTESVTRWLTAEAWGACADSVDRSALRGRRGFLGLDLSTTTDLTAAVLAFPPEDDEGVWDVLAWFWCPEETIALRSRRDRVPYELWVREGLLAATAGNSVDQGVVEAHVLALAEEFELEVDYDPWNAVALATRLQEQLGNGRVVPIRQGYQTLSEPTKFLERLVLARRIRHGGHPLLAWCLSNAVVRMDPAGNIKLDKSKATERIDGVAALVNALARGMVMIDTTSVYATRGIRSIGE